VSQSTAAPESSSPVSARQQLNDTTVGAASAITSTTASGAASDSTSAAASRDADYHAPPGPVAAKAGYSAAAVVAAEQSGNADLCYGVVARGRRVEVRLHVTSYRQFVAVQLSSRGRTGCEEKEISRGPRHAGRWPGPPGHQDRASFTCTCQPPEAGHCRKGRLRPIVTVTRSTDLCPTRSRRRTQTSLRLQPLHSSRR